MILPLLVWAAVIGLLALWNAIALIGRVGTAASHRRRGVAVVFLADRTLEPGKEDLMQISSVLIGLGIGFCTLALTWATARHFTGLAREHELALAVGILAGLIVGVGYVVIESRLFDSWQRRKSG